MSEDLLRRVPPQNIEAEQCIIGAVLIDNAQFEAVVEIITADDFYREAHRRIWDAIAALMAAKQPVDPVTLVDALRPQLEQVGGAGYFAECASAVALPQRACDYARMVREKAIQRRLATAGTEIAQRAYESPQPWSPDFTEELVASAEYEISSISAQLSRPPEAKKADVLNTAIWRLRHGHDDSVHTGFDVLDRQFGGFTVGHLTMLAARTSKGKTAFATTIALNAAKAGAGVAFFTLEMTAEEMWLRALACEAQVNLFRVRYTGYRDGEEARVSAARETLTALPLEMLYRPSMCPRELRLETRRIARAMPHLRLVVVDYFNLMRGDHHERERWREMQEAVLALKQIAGELNLPILLLSQLNREAKEDEMPLLSQLRDTGATEEHASNVLFIWQERSAREAPCASDDWEDVQLRIAKQRNGPAGLKIKMQFKKSCGVFIDG